MSELHKRIAFNRHIGRHLAEAGRLLRRELHRDDLLTVSETEALLTRAKGVKRAPAWKRELEFAEKSRPRFASFVKALEARSEGGVYLWTPLAASCGVPRPVRLSEIDFAFPFDVNPEGILEVLSVDLANRLLLDYSRDDNNREVLELEVEGASWGAVIY